MHTTVELLSLWVEPSYLFMNDHHFLDTLIHTRFVFNISLHWLVYLQHSLVEFLASSFQGFDDGYHLKEKEDPSSSQLSGLITIGHRGPI